MWTYVGGNTSAQLDHTAASVELSLPGGAAVGDVVVISCFINTNATASFGVLLDDYAAYADSGGDLGVNQSADRFLVDVYGSSDSGEDGTSSQVGSVHQLKTTTNPTISAFNMAPGDYGYARLDVFRSATGSFIADIRRRNLFANGNKGALAGTYDGSSTGTADTATSDLSLASDGETVAGQIGSGTFAICLATMFEDDSATSLNTATDDESNGYTEAAEVKDTTGNGLHWSVNYDISATVTDGMVFTVARTGGSGTPDFICLPVFLSEVGPAQTNYDTGALTKTPTFVAASTAQAITTDTTTVVNLPAGIQDGDILLIVTQPNVVLGSFNVYYDNIDASFFFSDSNTSVAPHIYRPSFGDLLIDSSTFTVDVLYVQTFAFRSVDHRTDESIGDFNYGFYYASENVIDTGQDMALLFPVEPSSSEIFADKYLHALVGGKKDNWTSVATPSGNPEFTWTERADNSTTDGLDAGIALYTAPQTTDIDINDLEGETLVVTGGASADYEVNWKVYPAEPLGTRKYATPTFVGAGALAGPANTGTLTPDLPAGIQDGDVLVLCAGGSITGTLAVDAGSDWDFANFTISPVVINGNTGGRMAVMLYPGTDTTTTITPTGNAATDNWWARVLAFRGVFFDSTELFSGVPDCDNNDNQNGRIPFSSENNPAVPGIGLAVMLKADDSSSVSGPGTVDGVTWIDHTHASTTTNDDASFVIGYFLNSTEDLSALDTDAAFTFSGGASASQAGRYIFIPASLNQLYYENTESGSTAASSTVTSLVQFLTEFLASGLIACESGVSHLVTFISRLYLGLINATSAITSTISAIIPSRFRIKSEWGTTGGGGRRRLNKDLAKVLTRPRRNQT